MHGSRWLAAAISAGTLAFLAATVAPVPAHADDSSPQVVITSATADVGLVNLVVRGRNFSRVRNLAVTLSGFTAPLTVVASNDTSITALLPLGVAPGSYTLTVGSAQGANGDSLDITLAAQRPPISSLSGIPCVWNGLPSVTASDVAVQDGRITLTCMPWPPGSVPQGTYEPLATSAATVRAALDLYTVSQSYPAPVSCSGPNIVNCPNGVPTPTSIHIEQAAVSITPITPTSYSFTLDERLSTVSDIQFAYSGLTCGVGIDTSRAGSPVMHVTGNVNLDSNPPPDPPNRVSFASLSFSPGIEEADLVFSGGSSCASLAPFLAPIIVQGVNAQFAARFGPLCGAPGPDLFVPCS